MKWFYRNWLYLLAVTLPFERIPSYDLAIGGRSVTIRASFLLALFIIGSALALSVYRRRWPNFTAPDKWAGVYALVMIASMGAAVSRGRSATVVFATVLVMGVAIVIEHSLDQFSLSKLYKYLVATAVVACGFGLYQFLGDSFGLPTALTGLKDMYTRHVFGFPRIQSTGLEPLFFASFLLLPLLLVVSRVYTKPAKLKHYALVWFLALVFALTLSRGGIYGAVGGLVVLAVLLFKRGSLKRLALIAVTIAVAAGCAVGLIAVTTRTNNSSDPVEKQAVSNYVKQSTHFTSEPGRADDDRSANRRLAIQAFREHPFIGVGIGNFGIYAQTHDPLRYGPNDKAVVNNEYLEVLAETGAVGLLALVGLFGALLWGFIRAWGRLEGAQQVWAVTIFSVLIAAAIQYYAFSTLYIIQLWFALGLLLGLIRMNAPRKA